MGRDISSSFKVYRTIRSVYLFFLAVPFLFFTAAPVDCFSADGNSRLDALLRSARELRLSEDLYWRILLHYKRKGSGMESLVDDPKFFLAPDGKTNPAAELEADLRGLFQQGAGDDSHPRCRFVARAAWLKERLAIDESRLPAIACSKWNEALALMNPKSAVLVFPAAHGNGPASMFGHTLIRIDGDARNDLLSYAVNYAADAADSNGLVYAYKGIFGYYRGYFSLLPYYDKVNEYNDMEFRDIWEYDLDLTEPEVLRMVMHIWELRDIYSDYYFFDENCSYDLLFLLEAARPSLRLTDAFWDRLKFWVIPLDTVRVVEESGIVTRAKYRPSRATRILAIASRMGSGLQDEALDIVNLRAAPPVVLNSNLAREEKMKALDLAAEVLQYGFSRKLLEKNEYQKQFLAVLKARSTLGAPDGDPYPVTPPPQPESGHLPGKIGLGLGYRADSLFAELQWKPAYHDLLDPDEGYIQGAQINFCDLRGRYFFNEGKLRLQSLRVIDIVSLSPRDKFFTPISWKVNTGLDREMFADGGERLLYRVNPGGGIAYKNSALGLAYVFLESDLNISAAWEDKYSLGIGASAGVLRNVTEYWKFNLTAQELFYKLGEEHRSAKASLAQNFRMTANSGILLSVSRERAFDHSRSEIRVMWNMYL